MTAENRLEAFLRARAGVDTVATWYAYGAGGGLTLADATLYATPLLTLTRHGYTKHYFDGTRRLWNITSVMLNKCKPGAPSEMVHLRRGKAISTPEMVHLRRGKAISTPEMVHLRRGKAISTPEMVHLRRGKAISTPEMVHLRRGKAISGEEMAFPRSRSAFRTAEMMFPIITSVC